MKNVSFMTMFSAEVFDKDESLHDCVYGGISILFILRF